jgi:uncharacterized HhH-GPD family protein
MGGTVWITGDETADALVNSDGLALLIGMLLDQQVPMEWAFRGPATLRQRLGHLDPTAIAAMDREQLVSVCCQKPAIHRYPAAMGRRIHSLCRVIADAYDGRASAVWEQLEDAHQLSRRLSDLPGFGEEKTMIFVALLAKRFDVRPAGWEEVAGPFADDTPRSVADSHDPQSLGEVRRWKQRQRRAGRSKQDD